MNADVIRCVGWLCCSSRQQALLGPGAQPVTAAATALSSVGRYHLLARPVLPHQAGQAAPPPPATSTAPRRTRIRAIAGSARASESPAGTCNSRYVTDAWRGGCGLSRVHRCLQSSPSDCRRGAIVVAGVARWPLGPRDRSECMRGRRRDAGGRRPCRQPRPKARRSGESAPPAENPPLSARVAFLRPHTNTSSEHSPYQPHPRPMSAADSPSHPPRYLRLPCPLLHNRLSSLAPAYQQPHQET